MTNTLTIYSRPNCGFCVMAKSMLDKNDIPYHEVDVSEDPDALNYLKEQGHRTVPQFYLNEELFVEGGYQGLREIGVDGIRQKLTEVTEVE